MSTRIPAAHRRPHLNGKAHANGKPAGKAPDPAAPSQTEVDGGRGPGGKFAAGNKLGRGNPLFRELAAKRKAFTDAVTTEDVAALARKLLAAALAGDTQAASLVLQYAVGKPTKAVNPDEADLDEFRILDAAPTRSRVFAVASEALDPAAAAALLRDTIPADDEGVTGRVLKIGKNENALMDARAEQRAKVGRK